MHDSVKQDYPAISGLRLKIVKNNLFRTNYG